LPNSELTFVHLSDTHIVAKDSTYLGYDSARYLRDAIGAVNALRPRPAFALVTGDLCHTGSRAEYEHFVELFAALDVPYYVLPGNHDRVETLRAVIPAQAWGGAERATGAFAFEVDVSGLRLIALDSTKPRVPGGWLGDDRLDWLTATLAAAPATPTALALHQPPFRTGMHYLDFLPYPGADRLRTIVESNPQIALLLGGHIHCVRARRWKGTLALTAPSTAPQVVPELFERRPFALRLEPPGFIVHRGTLGGAFEATVHRRAPASGDYVPTERALT
jgi:3',5'-cyclic AMP phosphodiesterase CpdA